MIFSDANGRFIEEVTEGLSRFGINNDKSQKGSSKDTTIFHMYNTVHNSEYIAVGKRKKSGLKAGETWQNIIDRDLIPSTAKYLKDGKSPAGALIVPSTDAKKVIEMLEAKGAKPSVYQLFDGYVVAGLSKIDMQSIATEAVKELEANEPPKPPKKASKPVEEVEETKPDAIEKQIDEPIELVDKNEIIETVQNNIEPELNKNLTEKASSTPLGKKLMAAAMLGIALGATPFAVDFAQDKFTSKEDNQIEIVDGAKMFFDDVTVGSQDDLELLKLLASNPNATEDFLRAIADTPISTNAIQNPNIPADILEKAYNSNNIEKLKAAALNPNTPLDVLEELSKDVNSDIRANVAKNPNITKDMMNNLASDIPKVRNSLLDNENLQLDVHDKIARQGGNDCNFLEKLMANPCVPQDVLNYNMKNSNECTRRGVAANPNTSPEALSQLASDKDDKVRRNALSNHNTPEDALAKNLDSDFTPKNYVNDMKRVEDIKAALKNPNIHPDVIKKALAASPEDYASSIASNKNLPSSITEHMESIARGKKGLENFIDNSVDIKSSVPERNKLRNNAKSYNGNIEKALRSKLNKDFANDVFDPYKLASLGDGAFNKNKPIQSYKINNTNDTNNAYSIDDMADTSSKFSNSIPADSNISSAPLLVADNIIDNVINTLLPSLTGTSGGSNSGSSGSGTSGGGGGTSGGLSGDGGGVDSSKPDLSLGGSGAGVATVAVGTPTNFNFSAPPQNIADTEVSDWIFKNACDNIDTLTNIM